MFFIFMVFINNKFCRCLHYFNSNEKLEVHSTDCSKMNDCAIRLPDKNDKWLSFKNYCRKERVPFIVYADLECILEKTDPSSHMYQHHRVFSVGYYALTTIHYPCIDFVAIMTASYGSQNNLEI